MTSDKCTFSSKVGACVGVVNASSSLVLRGGVVSQGGGAGEIASRGAGVLVADGARAHGIKVLVSENKCAG